MRSAIDFFYTSTGEKVYVQYMLGERQNKYPFAQMHIGDWFDVPYSFDLAGNVTSLASTYGKKLGRKFKTRTVGPKNNQSMRVTRTK